MKAIILPIMILIAIFNLFAQQKGDAFKGINALSQNGYDRRDSSEFKHLKFFTTAILMDFHFTHSFNNPSDNKIVAGLPERKRFHSDNCVLLQYSNLPESSTIGRMAFSLTGDIRFEKGDSLLKILKP